jgi:hypothetical protein
MQSASGTPMAIAAPMAASALSTGPPTSWSASAPDPTGVAIAAVVPSSVVRTSLAERSKPASSP